MERKYYKFDKEIQKLLADTMALVYEINCDTEAAAFLDFHGHVASLSVKLAEGKGGSEVKGETPCYNRELARKEFYVSGKLGQGVVVEKLTELNRNLREACRELQRPRKVEL